MTGAILGLVVGLFYSWVVSPVKYVDAPPYALRADFKNNYRVLVAAAYLYSNDLVRAEDRLAQLRDDDPAQSLAMQAQQALAAGRPEAEVRALGLLAIALGEGFTPPASSTAHSQEAIILTPGAENTTTPPGVIGTPANTILPSSTATPTPAEGASFVVGETRLACNPAQPVPLIQVEILDAAQNPVPGLELVVTWEGGEDHFFTGLKPELGLGYADFNMTPGVVYSFHLEGGEQEVDDLSAAECQAEDGSRYWGSWRLTFIQP